MDAADTGRQLAERHRSAPAVADDVSLVHSLLNYAEAPHVDDWTLRASLVRLAQPQPVRVGALLEVMRRLDAPLHHVQRVLERQIVSCDAGLTVTGLGGPPVQPYPDVRTADLARLAAELGAADADVDDLIGGYDAVAPLVDEERLAVPLLAVAVRLEGLAGQLTEWGRGRPADPPVDAVDDVVAFVRARLDELGVPVETGPPPGARGGRRG